MTDTMFWAILLIAGAALILAILAHRTATEALRIARAGGAGNASISAGTGSRADRAAGKKLAERANALLQKVNALPPALLGPGADGKARDSVLWVAAEVASLKEAAPSLGGAEALASAEESMAWLLERTGMIRATQRGSGMHLVDFPHDAWRRNYQGALTALQELVARGEAASK